MPWRVVFKSIAIEASHVTAGSQLTILNTTSPAIHNIPTAQATVRA
jgi:hypothetical protein